MSLEVVNIAKVWINIGSMIKNHLILKKYTTILYFILLIKRGGEIGILNYLIFILFQLKNLNC